MSTTNLLQWNPTAANQETDAQYLADSQRSGGATNPSLFDATLANKLFYQTTTYLYALFTAFANKGFTTSDSSAATLVAQCANFLTTADVKPGLVNVPYATAVTFDASKANGFEVALTGGTTVTLINATVGQIITLAFQQDAVGGRTVALPGIVLSPGTVDPTANSTSVQTFQVLTDGYLHPIAPMVVS